MDEAAVRKLLDQLTAGEIDADEAVGRLRALPYTDLGFATLDSHRQLRQGVPEAVYGPGKTPAQCAAIVASLLSTSDGPVLLSRADADQVAAALAANPGAVVTGAPAAPAATTSAAGATVVWRTAPRRAGVDDVVVVTAGTADLPVAAECIATLAALGFGAALVADVGVAGIHRVLDRVPLLQRAPVVVVVAGMEGALASVVGGLTGAPVVAVPTSTGYGAALQGVTALLSMLTACASGLVVVGIDNGFGAAFAVHRLLGVVR